jgi:hypothetical protein
MIFLSILFHNLQYQMQPLLIIAILMYRIKPKYTGKSPSGKISGVKTRKLFRGVSSNGSAILVSHYTDQIGRIASHRVVLTERKLRLAPAKAEGLPEKINICRTGLSFVMPG